MVPSCNQINIINDNQLFPIAYSVMLGFRFRIRTPSIINPIAITITHNTNNHNAAVDSKDIIRVSWGNIGPTQKGQA